MASSGVTPLLPVWNQENGTVPHTLRQYRHPLRGRSRRCRLWPCWTWRRRSQSLRQCSRAYRCLHLSTRERKHTHGGTVTNGAGEHCPNRRGSHRTLVQHHARVLTRFLSSVLLLCVQPLLGTELREWEQRRKHKWGDFLLRYRFILEFRSVIAGKLEQPPLIKINDGKGDLAQRSQEAVHNLFFPTSPPIHQQLKRAWDDGQTQCSPSLRSLAPSHCGTKLARRPPI